MWFAGALFFVTGAAATPPHATHPQPQAPALRRHAVDGRALVARERPWFTPFLPEAAMYLRTLDHRGSETSRTEFVIGVSLIWTLDKAPTPAGGR